MLCWFPWAWYPIRLSAIAALILIVFYSLYCVQPVRKEMFGKKTVHGESVHPPPHTVWPQLRSYPPYIHTHISLKKKPMMRAFGYPFFPMTGLMQHVVWSLEVAASFGMGSCIPLETHQYPVLNNYNRRARLSRVHFLFHPAALVTFTVSYLRKW